MRSDALGTAILAVGARGGVLLFAILARFTACELEKNGTCRIALLSQKSLSLCQNGPKNLTLMFSTHSDRKFDAVRTFYLGELFSCNPPNEALGCNVINKRFA